MRISSEYFARTCFEKWALLSSHYIGNPFEMARVRLRLMRAQYQDEFCSFHPFFLGVEPNEKMLQIVNLLRYDRVSHCINEVIDKENVKTISEILRKIEHYIEFDDLPFPGSFYEQEDIRLQVGIKDSIIQPGDLSE